MNLFYFFTAKKTWSFGIPFCLLFILIITTLKAQTVFLVQDCKNNEPLDRVIIRSPKENKAYSTNEKGICELPSTAVGNTFLLSKLGYTSKEIMISNKKMDVCLTPQNINLGEVEVKSKVINLYEKLMSLRKKNLSEFPKNDTTLFYQFNYKSVDVLSGHSIDSASGFYYVDYRNYKYPMSIFNSKGSQICHFHYGSDSTNYSVEFLKKIKVISISSMLALFNLMDKGSSYDWKSIKQNKEIIIYEQMPDSTQIFSTFLNDDLSKIFHFDDKDNILKIEYYITQGSRRNLKDSIPRKIAVYYKTSYPKMATRLEQSFTGKKGGITYRTSLILNLTSYPKTTIVQRKDKLLNYFPLSGMFKNFYQESIEIKDFIKNGIVLEVKK